jgi:hypothetical protein
MSKVLKVTFIFSSLIIFGCASPPKSDPSKVQVECAQQCSSHLAECSSGFKLFPVIAQGQCNDAYDTCIKGCPVRQDSQSKNISPTVAERLKRIVSLLKSGAITQEEYNKKREEIVRSL